MFRNQNPKLIDRFEDWWHRNNQGLPLMWVVAQKEGPREQGPQYKDYEDMYMGADFLLGQTKAGIQNNIYLGDSYADSSCSIGPGSLNVYLGSKPVFAPHTVWYETCITDLRNRKRIRFDPDEYWFRKHIEVLRTLRQSAEKYDYIVNIPDIIENMDVLAALRGTEDLLIDMIDDPEAVLDALDEIYEAYSACYDLIYDVVKTTDGISSYFCFGIMGRGKTAKVQCDFSAMISPDQYRRFVVPTLEKQIDSLDHTLYHLDGPDAIRHIPAIMEIRGLDALQWTAGAGKPDGASPDWYVIYDQVAAAGKSMWVQIYDGGVDKWIDSADRFIDRYGTKSCFFIFPHMSEKDAYRLMEHAHSKWN